MSDITSIKTDLYNGQPTTPDNQKLLLSQACSSTATEIVVNFLPVDEDGANVAPPFYIGVLKSDGFLETMLVTSVSSTTWTVTRGIQPAGLDLTTGSASFAAAHSAGEPILFNITSVFITMLYEYTKGNIAGGLKLNAAPSYSGEGIMTVPIYADATARDAAITSPTNGMMCYNTGTGVMNQYVGGAWTNAASGTTVNATAIAAGKVQLATAAEITAGTEIGTTGASLVGTPNLLAAGAQSGEWTAGTATGTDTYALALTPTLTAYSVGMTLTVVFTNGNTGAATIDVDTVGATDIKTTTGNALLAGDIAAGETIDLAYDGTNFTLQKTVQSDLGESFWGTGADGAIAGALTITGSNDTQIEKNYTTFAPGANTVTVTPTNCITIIRCSGDVDLTGTTFAFTGKGGQGGATATSPFGGDGNDGDVGNGFLLVTGGEGGLGSDNRTGDDGGGGGAGGSISTQVNLGFYDGINSKDVMAACGSGGGSGGIADTGWEGGAGGDGGGCLIMYVGGNLTLSTTTMSFNGTDGTIGGQSTNDGGGGAGGGGGSYFIGYKGTLTGSQSADITEDLTGGAGAASGTGGTGGTGIDGTSGVHQLT